MTIKGYAAHFGRANKNNERLSRGAFDYIISEFDKGTLNIPINIDHTDRIIGKVVEMRVDNTGLYIIGEIFDDIPEAVEIQKLIENGLYDYMSTEGYINRNECTINEDGTYTVSRFRLTAIAVVNQPADGRAVLSVAGVDNGTMTAFGCGTDAPTPKRISIHELI